MTSDDWEESSFIDASFPSLLRDASFEDWSATDNLVILSPFLIEWVQFFFVDGTASPSFDWVGEVFFIDGTASPSLDWVGDFFFDEGTASPSFDRVRVLLINHRTASPSVDWVHALFFDDGTAEDYSGNNGSSCPHFTYWIIAVLLCTSCPHFANWSIVALLCSDGTSCCLSTGATISDIACCQ